MLGLPIPWLNEPTSAHSAFPLGVRQSEQVGRFAHHSKSGTFVLYVLFKVSAIANSVLRRSWRRNCQPTAHHAPPSLASTCAGA